MAQGSQDPMMQQPFNAADQNLTDVGLTQVHDGMKVYDRDGKEVGKVEGVYLGEVNEKVNDRGEGAATARNTGTSSPRAVPAPIPAATSQSYVGATIPPQSSLDIDGLPEVVRNRMARLGFIRIGGGIFGGTRFALPDQIANVEGDRVNLNITRDELIKR